MVCQGKYCSCIPNVWGSSSFSPLRQVAEWCPLDRLPGVLELLDLYWLIRQRELFGLFCDFPHCVTVSIDFISLTWDSFCIRFAKCVSTVACVLHDRYRWHRKSVFCDGQYSLLRGWNITRKLITRPLKTRPQPTRAVSGWHYGGR